MEPETIDQSDLLHASLQTGDPAEARRQLEDLTSSEAVRAFLQLSPDDRKRLLELVGPVMAADLLEEIPTEQAVEIFESLESGNAADIIEEMDTADGADIIHDLDDEDAENILGQMRKADAKKIRALAEYEPDVAGGLMSADIFKFRRTETTGDVLKQLASEENEFEQYQGQHPYIVDSRGILCGVVSLRKLLTSKRSTGLKEVMVEASSVGPLTPLGDLEDIFDDEPYLSVPVVEENGKLIGVVTRDAVAHASLERAEMDALKASGLVEDELRSMPTFLRAKRRLSWLTVNIGLNILAAGIISTYEETLSAVIALAVFLPMVSDMSGCTGNQAVAVSMRELALGVTRPTDLLYVWLKEMRVGIINGIALGILIGLVAWIWKGNPYIGLVIGTALALNTLIAVSVGGLVPLLLKRFDIDPAVASGPMLTTITDMFGFFLVLSLATAMMPLLL